MCKNCDRLSTEYLISQGGIPFKEKHRYRKPIKKIEDIIGEELMAYHEVEDAKSLAGFIKDELVKMLEGEKMYYLIEDVKRNETINHIITKIKEEA